MCSHLITNNRSVCSGQSVMHQHQLLSLHQAEIKSIKLILHVCLLMSTIITTPTRKQHAANLLTQRQLKDHITHPPLIMRITKHRSLVARHHLCYHFLKTSLCTELFQIRRKKKIWTRCLLENYWTAHILCRKIFTPCLSCSVSMISLHPFWFPLNFFCLIRIFFNCNRTFTRWCHMLLI